MIKQHEIDLINRANDAESLSASEQAELDSCLSSSPEAREYQNALRLVDEKLKGAPALTLPTDLHDNIMATLATLATANDVPTYSWNSVVRYGLAATVMLALAVGFYQFRDFSGMPEDYQQMTGTIVGPAKPSLQSAYEFDQSGIVSKARLRPVNDRMQLALDVSSTAPIDIELRINESGWRLDESQPDATQSIEMQTKQRLLLRSQGEQQYIFFLRPDQSQSRAAPQITIEYRQQNIETLQRVLEFNVE